MGPDQAQQELARLLVHAAGDGVPDLLPGLSARPRHLDFLHRHQDRPAGQFIGIENYEWLWDDAIFWLSVFNTLLYTFIASAIKFAIGLYLALLLNENMPFKAMLRALVLIPFIVPTVLSALAFWWIFDSQFSIISWSLKQLGLIDQNINFLGDTDLGADLRDLRQYLARRAVRRDHAAGRPADRVSPRSTRPRRSTARRNWQMFRYITYPLLTPIIAVVMTFSVLFTFTDFQLIWAMTRGGPVNATHLMATLVLSARDHRRPAGRGRRDLQRDDPVPARRDHGVLVRPAAAQVAAGREQ